MPRNPEYGIPVNAMSYGPVVNEYHRDAMWGTHDNRLGPRDVAVSPNLSGQFPYGSQVVARDARGNPIGTYNVADTSWYSPGNPTQDSVEFRDANRDGQVYLSGIGRNPNPDYQTPRANSSPQRPENTFVRLGSDVLGRTPVGGALNFTQALARGKVMTDTPIGRLLQSLGHLFGGTLGRHAPISIDPWSGTVSGGKGGGTGTQYGIDPYTGKPVMNADPAGGGGGGGYAGGSGYGGGGYGDSGFTGGGYSGGEYVGGNSGYYGGGQFAGMPGGRLEQFFKARYLG